MPNRVAVRFISAEPLLGPVDFRKVPTFNRIGLDLSNFWVIVGGESGPGARPMDPAWARSLMQQCANASVPFFMKQMGSVFGPSKGHDLPADLNIKQFPVVRP